MTPRNRSSKKKIPQLFLKNIQTMLEAIDKDFVSDHITLNSMTGRELELLMFVVSLMTFDKKRKSSLMKQYVNLNRWLDRLI
jgi:uncharacterized protein (UPF0276 family)